jgi:Sulfotransferase family/Methyltransferase domain
MVELGNAVSEPRPVFVIGSPRSGTSILTLALGQHPNLLALEETSWLIGFANNLAASYQVGTSRGDRSHLSAMSISEAAFFGAFGGAIGDLINRSVDEQRARFEPRGRRDRFELLRSPLEPKRRWVDGTPENVYAIYGLSLLFPAAQFIHLVRDVRSVVRSLLHFESISGTSHSVDSAYFEWLSAVRQCELAERAFGPDRVLRLSYRRLADSPDDTLRSCLEFLGEPWDASCLDPMKTRINQSVIPAEEWALPASGVDSALVAEAERLSAQMLEPVVARTRPDPTALQELQALFSERALGSADVARVVDLVSNVVPRGARLAVVSGGSDDLLVELRRDGQKAMHLSADGAAHVEAHPTNGEEALNLIRTWAERFGGGFAVIPASQLWWLEEYPQLAGALDQADACLAFEPDAGAIYDLSRLLEVESVPRATSAREVGGLRTLVEPTIWPAATVAVAALGRDDLMRIPAAKVVAVPNALGVKSGEEGRRAAIREVETMHSEGVDFLVVPEAAQRWLAQRPSLHHALAERHDLMVSVPGVGAVYGLRASDQPRATPRVRERASGGEEWKRMTDMVIGRSETAPGLRDIGELVGRLLWENVKANRLQPLFEACQEAGVHLTPVHYYFPVPDTRQLDDAFWASTSSLRGLDMREDYQLELVRNSFAAFADECRTLFSSETTNGRGSPSLDNDMFGGTDALALYCMIRHFAPRLIVEVGAGLSTRVAAAAAQRSGGCRLISIEPFPSNDLRAGGPDLTTLIEKTVQEVDLGLFDELKENDILFIDSSHMVKIGSDVVHLLLEVVPRLNPGVIVHIHDIYLPRQYRREWVLQDLRFWTEQYLLQAFLAFNTDFEVLLCNNFFEERYPGVLREVFPESPWWGGGSFWMRRMPK